MKISAHITSFKFYLFLIQNPGPGFNVITLYDILANTFLFLALSILLLRFLARFPCVSGFLL